MRTVAPVSPGEMLDEEFLKPIGLTKYRLAKDIGVPPPRIGDIVAGKRAITADTDLRLCRYFGLSDGWWLRGQANYDIAIARETMGEVLAQIPRCNQLAACSPQAVPEDVPCGEIASQPSCGLDGFGCAPPNLQTSSLDVAGSTERHGCQS